MASEILSVDYIICSMGSHLFMYFFFSQIEHSLLLISVISHILGQSAFSYALFATNRKILRLLFINRDFSCENLDLYLGMSSIRHTSMHRLFYFLDRLLIQISLYDTSKGCHMMLCNLI